MSASKSFLFLSLICLGIIIIVSLVGWTIRLVYAQESLECNIRGIFNVERSVRSSVTFLISWICNRRPLHEVDKLQIAVFTHNSMIMASLLILSVFLLKKVLRKSIKNILFSDPKNFVKASILSYLAKNLFALIVFLFIISMGVFYFLLIAVFSGGKGVTTSSMTFSVPAEVYLDVSAFATFTFLFFFELSKDLFFTGVIVEGFKDTYGVKSVYLSGLFHAVYTFFGFTPLILTYYVVCSHTKHPIITEYFTKLELIPATFFSLLFSFVSFIIGAAVSYVYYKYGNLLSFPIIGTIYSSFLSLTTYKTVDIPVWIYLPCSILSIISISIFISKITSKQTFTQETP